MRTRYLLLPGATGLAYFLLANMMLAQSAVPVEIVAAEKVPLVVDSRLVGTIEATNAYPGAFRSGGRIVEVAVDIGDHVAAGTVMARIDPAQAEAAVAAASAQLAAAATGLQQATDARDRASSLLERGVGTRAQLDAAEEAYLGARASHDQAEAQLASARQAVADTVITAREDTVVLDRKVNPGEIVGAGQEVLSLASDGRLEAVFLSPDITGLAALRDFEIVLHPVGQDPFTTRVTEISPVLTATGTVEVRAAVPVDAAAGLNIGESIVGDVRHQGVPVISVPWTALAATGDGPAVWTVDPGEMTVRLTPITIADYRDFTIDVSDGLAAGDLVVGAGSQALYQGMKVRAVEGRE